MFYSVIIIIIYSNINAWHSSNHSTTVVADSWIKCGFYHHYHYINIDKKVSSPWYYLVIIDVLLD